MIKEVTTKVNMDGKRGTYITITDEHGEQIFIHVNKDATVECPSENALNIIVE